MSARANRYRITVTPVETDGLQCQGRCTIEFERASREDWMRLVEAAQQQRGFSGDEGAALAVATQLLGGLAASGKGDDALAQLRPHLVEFIERMKLRSA